MSSFGCTIDVEDRESSVVADDTYSINSDASRQSLTPRPLDSCSIHSDTAWTPPSPQSTSRLSRFLNILCCFGSRRRKQNRVSAEHLNSSRSQNEAHLRTYVEKLEEAVKTCKDRAQAEQLYIELEDTVSHIKILMSNLQDIISKHSVMVDEHREKPQLLLLTSSMSEKLFIQLTEKEDEVRALKEQCNKRVQQLKQLEDENQDQREQAKQFEIDYRVEVEENELLRAENDTLKHQLDSGLVVCLDDEGDDNTGEIDDPKRVISGLKAQVKTLIEDVNKLRDHSKRQSRQILKYKQQVEVTEFMEGQVESMEKMYHDLKEECNQMHKELVDTKQNLQDNLQIKEELQNEVAAVNAQLAVYKADFDQERQDRAEAHSRMAELEKKGVRAKGQIESEREAYHREHQDLKHDYQIACGQLEQHQLALSAVEEANENLRQEIQAKSSQVKQYAKEVDRLKRELEESRKRISERTATPTGVSGIKQSKLEDLYKTAQDDIQYLSEENSRHQDRIEMLEREIEQLISLQRIAESAGSQAHTPYGRKVVEVNPPEQPLYAEEALHKGPYIHHDPVSPLTGQKQSQLAPRAVHVMVDEIEADGPNPYSKAPLHLPKHPANQTLSPEQESVAPKQVRPDQQEKVLAPNFQADLYAPPVHLPPHVAPLPPPSSPQQLPQATVMPIQPVNTHDAQLYNPQAPQQSTKHYHGVEDNRELEDSTAQFENPLVKELDDEIHQQAAEVIQEVSGGMREVKTDRQRPFDPNLVCPMCRRQFRIGEIQKFKRHVNTCTGTDD